MNNKLQLGLVSIVFASLMLVCGCTSQNNSNQNDQSFKEDFVSFSYPPADLEKVVFIIPLGTMKDEHVFPTDHQYYVASYYQGLDDENVVDVYSPGDGVITEIEHHEYPSGQKLEQDYRIIIKHSSKIFSYYIHVDNISEKIAETVIDLPAQGHEDIKPVTVNIPVEAGEKIGTYKGLLDYNVVDYGVEIGYINPESYSFEEFKLHIQDPFIYFDDSVKTQLIAKCQRSEEPIGGTIDYDVDGRLVGNWFLGNANEYDNMEGERNALIFAYNNIDTDHIVVSIGLYENSACQFGIKGNSPDPADISVESGLIKLELTNYNYFYNGQMVEPDSLMKGLTLENEEQIQGIILLQLIEDQKLKMEVFPGSVASEVAAFTDNFRIYER